MGLALELFRAPFIDLANRIIDIIIEKPKRQLLWMVYLRRKELEYMMILAKKGYYSLPFD